MHILTSQLNWPKAKQPQKWRTPAHWTHAAKKRWIIEHKYNSTSSSGNSSKMKESRLFNKLNHIYDSQTLLYLNSSQIKTQRGTEGSQTYLFRWTVVHIVEHVKFASHYHQWFFYLQGFWMWWVFYYLLWTVIQNMSLIMSSLISVYVSVHWDDSFNRFTSDHQYRKALYFGVKHLHAVSRKHFNFKNSETSAYFLAFYQHRTI